MFTHTHIACCISTGKKTGVHALPGDNPVYDGGDAAIVLGALPWTDVPIHYENLSPNAGRTSHKSAPHREFDNPIYGRTQLENGTYTHPDNCPQTGVGLGAAPYHEFDNPIYGREIDDNTYSVISDSSVPNGTAPDARNRVYENINEEAPLAGSQQI